MDTETFLVNRDELCRQLRARRAPLEEGKPSRWAWLGESLNVVSKLSGNSAAGWLPKLLIPLAAPMLGVAVGVIRNKAFPGGKKPFWMRLVPFL